MCTLTSQSWQDLLIKKQPWSMIESSFKVENSLNCSQTNSSKGLLKFAGSLKKFLSLNTCFSKRPSSIGRPKPRSFETKNPRRKHWKKSMLDFLRGSWWSKKLDRSTWEGGYLISQKKPSIVRISICSLLKGTSKSSRASVPAFSQKYLGQSSGSFTKRTWR